MTKRKAKTGCGKEMCKSAEATGSDSEYILEDQIGYLLRLAGQRHTAIFQENITDGLTPTQFSTLIRISEQGHVSQNHLGRLAAMDVATIKGVVDRLKAKALVEVRPHPEDKRRTNIFLTEKAEMLIGTLKKDGRWITEKTLAPLSGKERAELVKLLKKIT